MEECRIDEGVLALESGEVCLLSRNHPEVLERLEMGDSSTLIVRDPPGYFWQVLIKEAYIGEGALWDLRGEYAGATTPHRRPYEGRLRSGGPRRRTGTLGCRIGRSGSAGQTGTRGGHGVNVNVVMGIGRLDGLMIDGSGGRGGTGGHGGPGEDGTLPTSGCSTGGEPGAGGPGGAGGTGGNGANIGLRYFSLTDAPEVAEALADATDLDDAFEVIDRVGRIPVDPPAGLVLINEPGEGGAGGSGGPGGMRAIRPCDGCSRTGAGGTARSGSTGPDGSPGTATPPTIERIGG